MDELVNSLPLLPRRVELDFFEVFQSLGVHRAYLGPPTEVAVRESHRVDELIAIAIINSVRVG